MTRRAAAAAAAVVLAGCGPPKGATPAASSAVHQPPALPPRKLDDVFVLEAAGVEPDDTSVTVPAGAGRVVVLRRSAPDFGLFARLDFPEGVLTGSAGTGGAGGGARGETRAARLTIRPTPGIYGLELELEGSVADGATIVFSYGAHFVAPAGARQRFGNDIAFERKLAIGRVTGDTLVVFLPTSRPGSDMLSAPLPGPGRYLVAAPR
ncbi:MAG TPA: hypothetical protein VGQ17_14115 [Gemmatimonadales bacterium]|jgi:hypothetical protein|nr:hypothetical protein [Gemmatimonadales bacterium]